MVAWFQLRAARRTKGARSARQTHEARIAAVFLRQFGHVDELHAGGFLGRVHVEEEFIRAVDALAAKRRARYSKSSRRRRWMRVWNSLQRLRSRSWRREK